jgi:hypothetical protein
VGVAAARGGGYWVATGTGAVVPEGGARSFGQVTVALDSPIVGIAATPSGGGYYLVGADGGVFAFGDAAFYGSTGADHLAAPIVGMAVAAGGAGYWLVGADGGVFAFGDARFHGSTGGVALDRPVVGMAPTADGAGYWLVASDGGVFAFGDARFHGSTGGVRLAQPIVGLAGDPVTGGYWLVAADGGVFSFAAPFLGSAGGRALPGEAVGLVASPTGEGYWVALGTGQVLAYGSAPVVAAAPVDLGVCRTNPAGRLLLLVSVSEQSMWACDGPTPAGESRVTTASAALGEITPTGTWHLEVKATDVDLRGCAFDGCWDDFVNYWMAWNGPYGFHDATWQTFPFGNSAYATDGSHGCAHLPLAVARWMYAWAPIGTTVTIAA